MAAKLVIPEDSSCINAAWLQQAMLAGGEKDFPALRDVRVEEIGVGVGTTAQLLRCHLIYDQQSLALPQSIIIKMHSHDPKARRLNNLLSIYWREYAFYHNIQPYAPLRTPRLWYSDFNQHRQHFVLLLEDLQGMETLDQIAGIDAARAQRVITAIAQLHGKFWNKTHQPPVASCFGSLQRKSFTSLQKLYAVKLHKAIAQHHKLLSPATQQLFKAFGLRLAEHERSIARGPVSFGHGDYRLDNLLYDCKTGVFVILDWQLSGISSPLYDVAYFLGNSITPEVRRQCEHQVLAAYHDQVCRLGAKNFSFDDCWLLYRKNTLACLLLIVFLLGGGVSLANERAHRLLAAALERRLAAVADLDGEEFLRGKARFSSARVLTALHMLSYKLRERLRT